MQITKITYRNSQYPDMLRHIAAPPKQLFCVGNLRTDIPLVAIVGTRKPTYYGRQITIQLARDLARSGVGIVSGLALGIDAIAHQAAVEAGGYTIAVQANGLNAIYPTSNRKLAIRILERHGAIVSEYEEGMPSLKQNFPARNRIISGLCRATIVTEADAKSGSLITANFAAEQNRLVMAVPGSITSPRSAGPNNLIKIGAIPVTNITDILAPLDLESQAVKVRPAAAQNAEEALIFKLIDQDISSSEQLIAESQMSASQFAHVISLMEITGKVRNLGAGTWIRR